MATVTQAPAQGSPPPATDPDSTNLMTLFMTAVGDPSRRVGLAGLAASLVLFAWMFRDVMYHFYYVWSNDENYSHGFLVPFLSLYFANLSAQKGPVRLVGGSAIGLTAISLALLLRLISIPLPIPFLADLALIIGVTGIFTLIHGSQALRRYWFAFFFLVFMVPLPVALYSRIASPLQLMASQIASTVMNLTGIPVLREGNKLTLPGNVEMFVAEACSGMRQLTGFMALTAAVAFLTNRPAWYRVVIVVSSIPIALTANIARIILTGYIMHFVNPKYASGPFHTLEGLLMMGFGLMLLNLECWLLDSLRSAVGGTSTEHPPESKQGEADEGRASRQRESILGW